MREERKGLGHGERKRKGEAGEALDRQVVAFTPLSRQCGDAVTRGVAAVMP